MDRQYTIGTAQTAYNHGFLRLTAAPGFDIAQFSHGSLEGGSLHITNTSSDWWRTLATIATDIATALEQENDTQ